MSKRHLKAPLAMLAVVSGVALLSTSASSSGLPTGKRQHKPFTMTKPVDKSTPSSTAGRRQYQTVQFRKNIDK